MAKRASRRCRRPRSISSRRARALAFAACCAFASVARAATCPAPLAIADLSDPDAVVGNGTPQSCTESALAAALAIGGVVVFDCGGRPVTIPVTSAKNVTKDTVLDGAGLVTLDGGGTTRILAVPSSFELGTPTLTVQRLTFTRGYSGSVGGNDTERGGGAIWVRGGSLRVIASIFEGNHGPATGQDVAGGAIYSVGIGSVAISGSVFRGNGASNGGAIGGLFADLAIDGTVIEDNVASGSGGNPGTGGNGGGIYLDGNDQRVSLCRVTLADNRANAFGGGLFRVSNNGVGPMLIERSSVLGNAIPDQATSMAGGLYLQGVQIELRDSTIAWNQARSAGGLFVGPNGTTVDARNVTIAENTALSSLAGGIAISGGVTGSIRNATIARNAAPGPVAFAGATTGGGDVVLENSIVDGNEAGNGWNPISCFETFEEGGGNLQWPVARAGGGSDLPGSLCSPSALVADSLLGALQQNGGPTLTIRPAPGSPATTLGGDCPATDQRGMPRHSDSCTAGAVELAPETDAPWVGVIAVASLARYRRTRRLRATHASVASVVRPSSAAPGSGTSL